MWLTVAGVCNLINHLCYQMGDNSNWLYFWLRYGCHRRTDRQADRHTDRHTHTHTCTPLPLSYRFFTRKGVIYCASHKVYVSATGGRKYFKLSESD